MSTKKKSLFQSMQQNIKEQANLTEQPEKVNGEPKIVGQPRKYNEPLKHIGFKIPLSANDKLRVLSQLSGQTTTQYLLKFIDEEYKKNKEVIDTIMQFRKDS